jgi:Cytotoxic
VLEPRCCLDEESSGAPYCARKRALRWRPWSAFHAEREVCCWHDSAPERSSPVAGRSAVSKQPTAAVSSRGCHGHWAASRPTPDVGCASRIGSPRMSRVPRPSPGFLDRMDYLGYVHGKQRWRSKDGKRLYTWDELHGEVEVFNRRGRHLGAVHAITGVFTKYPAKGRRISV